MANELVVYREPGWFAVELRQRFGLRALGVTNEDIVGIVEDADFRVRTEKTPLSAADRAVLRADLIYEAFSSILRWYEPSYGSRPRTYANVLMEKRQKRLVASMLSRQAKQPPILDAPLDASDPLSPAFVDKEPDMGEHHLSRCLPPCDWEMVREFFSSEEFSIFEARLHNVHCEKIRRELNYTPGVWKRIWRTFQRRAAFILDLERS